MDVLWFLTFATWDQVKQLLNHSCLHTPTLLCGFYLVTVFKMLNSKPAKLSQSCIVVVVFKAELSLYLFLWETLSRCWVLSKTPSALASARPRSRGTVPNPWQELAWAPGLCSGHCEWPCRALALHKQLKLWNGRRTPPQAVFAPGLAGTRTASSFPGWFQNPPECWAVWASFQWEQHMAPLQCTSLLGLSKKTHALRFQKWYSQRPERSFYELRFH